MNEIKSRLGPTDALRKTSKEALRESRRFAPSIIDALSAHIAILEQAGTIIAVNRAWREFAEANSLVPSNVCEGANSSQGTAPARREPARAVTATNSLCFRADCGLEFYRKNTCRFSVQSGPGHQATLNITRMPGESREARR
ncbi:MAG: hypothetical protein ABSG67_07105 [Thermoguttaceae bacterium]|jgi:nitrogen fixation/metabolism regulation signal transduction histidine kinase